MSLSKEDLIKIIKSRTEQLKEAEDKISVLKLEIEFITSALENAIIEVDTTTEPDYSPSFDDSDNKVVQDETIRKCTAKYVDEIHISNAIVENDESGDYVFAPGHKYPAVDNHELLEIENEDTISYAFELDSDRTQNEEMNFPVFQRANRKNSRIPQIIDTLELTNGLTLHPPLSKDSNGHTWSCRSKKEGKKICSRKVSLEKSRDKIKMWKNEHSPICVQLLLKRMSGKRGKYKKNKVV